ncbi:FCD domain-containing protein [uncultured Corynebacterium sp.]|uniref:FadR/GntR family transcriptional regulator n=1 Tax=uncultured Corynebacterium sp. TaxID=159447 RepID=UPI0025EF40D2|nr:FCD domain-containing protein [uncultured Corynebacterium sp.]
MNNPSHTSPTSATSAAVKAAASSPVGDSPVPLLTTVLEHIGTEIVTGVLKTDHTFTLQDICARFEISRTVAREAMRTLEHMGLVRSARRVGLTVQPMSEWNVFDPNIIAWRLSSDRSREAQRDSLNQLRLAIEPIAARLAALRATTAETQELVRLAERLHTLELEPSRLVGEELSTDLRFHSAILYASGNEFFAALAPNLLGMHKGRSIFGSRKRDPIAGTSDLHLELAHAIAAGHADAAERLSREILDEARASSS